MRRAPRKTSRTDAEKKPLAQPERPTAWQIWRDLSTESFALVASEADRSRMVERHKLVVNIIEINSQQLRCESAKAGVDIERACAVRDAKLPGAAPGADQVIAALDHKLASLDAEANRLMQQREFLNSSLAEFDAAASPEDDGELGRVGRA